MDYHLIDAAAAAHRLQIYGGFHPKGEDRAPEGTRTLLMLGPREPGFWTFVSAAAEFSDNRANPLDRWSARAIHSLAQDMSAQALFPFGGPPWHPFYSWAIRTGRCWASPVAFLVHDKAGLFVSFRGALAFTEHIDMPPPPDSTPCSACADRPCVSACPADVLDETRYDSVGCMSYVGSSAGADCLNKGCAVRRACPVSVSYPRAEAQSKFHQEALLRQRVPS